MGDCFVEFFFIINFIIVFEYFIFDEMIIFKKLKKKKKFCKKEKLDLDVFEVEVVVEGLGIIDLGLWDRIL